MKRYSLVRGTRPNLAAEIEGHAARAEHDGHTELAQRYRSARQDIAGHCATAIAGPFVFIADPDADPLHHTDVREGTREEILAELDQLGRDRSGNGKEEKARELAEAHGAVEAGAEEVRIGRTAIYRVISPPAGEK